MKKRDARTQSGLAARLHFPEDEKRLPWLPILLDAYAVADTGVGVALRNATKQSGKKLACGRGCGNCCSHQKDLPLYPHEIVGIYWYVSEKLGTAEQKALRTRLAAHQAGAECPFLLDGACSIHPLRPLGCRQFNVFDRPCAPGEDPYYTRPEDVMLPLAGYTDRVFTIVIPFYNMKKDVDPAQAVRLIRTQLMNLQTYDWKKLIETMGKTGADKA